MNVRRQICGSVATVFNDVCVRHNKERVEEEEGGGTVSVPRKFTDEREIMGSGGEDLLDQKVTARRRLPFPNKKHLEAIS